MGAMFAPTPVEPLTFCLRSGSSVASWSARSVVPPNGSSTSGASQTIFPDFASSATSRASMVPMNTLPYASATPRFAGPQHIFSVRRLCW